ncbi:MAG: hypothetical protein N3D84_00070 [Candidatus Woesearchaeota archaeon]|nr:hypothetical protein [Candidatus Woesearchaeota archaeon]
MKNTSSIAQVNYIIKNFGKLYSEELKINLKSKKESEVFKWFLASILFGKPIREQQAMNTYKVFALKKVTTPNAILKTGWNGLVKLLDMGGYVRYDFSTATKLLEVCKELKEKYGILTNMHNNAKDSEDLEKKVMEFKGIGPITANIFLREMRGIWKKANPEPAKIVKDTAKKLGISLNKFNRRTKYFARLECGLFRFGKVKQKNKKCE